LAAIGAWGAMPGTGLERSPPMLPLLLPLLTLLWLLWLPLLDGAPSPLPSSEGVQHRVFGSWSRRIE
jgi:hypothetical protein